MKDAEVIPVCTVADLRRLVSAAGWEVDQATRETSGLERLIDRVEAILGAMGASDGDAVCVRRAR